MPRVRPGVELVRATLLPNRELMTLDLPTLERPRKAISGGPGAGKWETSVAAATNWANTFTLTVWRFWSRVASCPGATLERDSRPSYTRDFRTATVVRNFESSARRIFSALRRSGQALGACRHCAMVCSSVAKKAWQGRQSP